MENKQELLKTAKNISALANHFYDARKKASNIDVSELGVLDFKPVNSNENTYLDYFANKKIRYVFEDLFNYLKDKSGREKEEMLLFLSLSAHNQDWDYVFQTIKEYRGRNYYQWQDNKQEVCLPFDIKSWGHMPQNYDTNLLKQIRNGLAHSKFEYDFKERKATISMNNGEFVVEAPIDYLIYLPNEIWEISEKSPSEETRQPTILFNTNGYDNGIWLLINNKKPEPINNINSRLKNLGVPKAGIEMIDKVTSLSRLIVDKPLVEKIEESQRLANIILEHVQNKENYIDIMKLIYNRFEVTVEKEVPITIQDDICNNEFSKLLIVNLLLNSQMAESEKQVILFRVLNIKNDDYNRNFLAFNAMTNIMLENNSNSTFGKFREKIKKTYIPYSLDELSMFLDIAYSNFVFNYLIEKNKEASDSQRAINELSNINASDFFEENEYTENLDVYEACYYIRNCVVHPNFMKRDGDKYILEDKDRRGNIVFKASIDRNKFIKLSSLVVNSLTDSEAQNQEESQDELEKESE